MMDYSKTRAVIGEPDPLLREAARHALEGMGFGRVTAAASLVKLHQAIRRDGTDLLVLNAHMDGDDTDFITSGIRSGKLGADPFTIVLVVMAPPTLERASAIADSGADDALPLPFAPEALVRKVLTYSGPRKPFVVTCDYMGPERRASPRADQPSATQIAVPNPLATANRDDYATRRDACRNILFQERVTRLTVQIGWLLKAIGDTLAAEDSPTPLLFRLDEIGKELARRTTDADRIAAIRRMLALALTLRTSQGGNPLEALKDLVAAAAAVHHP